MKLLGATHWNKLLRFNHPKGIRGEISAPFIYTMELDAPSNTPGMERSVPLTVTSLVKIFDQILPYSCEIFVELDDPIGYPGFFSLLECLDDRGASYHLQTKALWESPRTFLWKLRQLHNLNTLRVMFPYLSNQYHTTSSPDQNNSESLVKNLQTATASGFNVWTVTPLVQHTVERVKEIVIQAKELGAKGMAFTRHTTTANVDVNILSAGYRDILQLYEAGYQVVVEDCVPYGVRHGLVPRCRGAIGSCFIDGYGNVKVCRHTKMVLGNLLESTIDQLWMGSNLRRLRLSLFQEHSAHSLENIYQYGCPFGGGIEERSSTFNYRSEGVSDPPIELPLPTLDPIALDPALCPVPLFWFRIEPFGAILVKGRDFVPITERGTKIVAAMNGHRTLRSLRREFGKEVLPFIYALFCHQLIRLERKSR